MSFKYPYLILAIILAFMNIIWALLPNFLPVIGIILALPLVFVLPGYTLSEAFLFRGTLATSYRYRFILSFGLSLALDILIGFILNQLPWGLKAITWALSLSILTIFFSLLTRYRSHRFFTARIQLPYFSMHQFMKSKLSYVLIGLCLIPLIAALFLSTLLSVKNIEQQNPSFTQLWLLSSSSTANNCAVSIGAQSFETKTVNYRIVMMVNNVQVNTWPSVVLAPEEKWNRVITIDQPSKNSVYVEVMLYRLDNPLTVYRQVHIRLSNGENKGGEKC